MCIKSVYKPELLNSIAVYLENEAAIELSYNFFSLGIKINPGHIAHHNMGVYLLDYFPYYHLYGKLYWEDRLFVGLRAEYHLKKALLYRRDKWETWIALGNTQFRKRKYINAIKMYEEAGTYTEDGYPKWKEGNCRWVLKEFDKAEKAFLDAYNGFKTCEDKIEAICAVITCNIKLGKTNEQIETQYGQMLKNSVDELIRALENEDNDIVGQLLWYGCTKLLPILHLIGKVDCLSLLCNTIEKLDSYDSFITDDDLEIMKRVREGLRDDYAFDSRIEKQLFMLYPSDHVVRQLYVVEDDCNTMKSCGMTAV